MSTEFVETPPEQNSWVRHCFQAQLLRKKDKEESRLAMLRNSM
jgi:hypothetical protein